jgi:hypothetical protein
LAGLATREVGNGMRVRVWVGKKDREEGKEEG